MGYQTGQAKSLFGSGDWYPGKRIKEGIGKVIGNFALKNRRPVGYETKKGHTNVRAPEEETNWSDRIRGPLYRGLFNLDEGSDIYNVGEEGGYSLNPDNKEAKEIQWNLNKSFQKAKEEGELFTHPDLPDAGKNFYKSSDPTLGDAYFDKKGNVVDYWNVGLDKGEKIWGGLGSIMPGGKPWINKSNLLRAAIAPFTSPKTFTGKATDSSEVGVYSPEEATQTPEKDGWYPGKNIKAFGGAVKDRFGGLLDMGKRSFNNIASPVLNIPTEQTAHPNRTEGGGMDFGDDRNVAGQIDENLDYQNAMAQSKFYDKVTEAPSGKLDQPDMSSFYGPIQTASDPRQLAKTINPNDKDSVMAFQKSVGFTGTDVDGILGKNTLAKLREVQGLQ